MSFLKDTYNQWVSRRREASEAARASSDCRDMVRRIETMVADAHTTRRVAVFTSLIGSLTGRSPRKATPYSMAAAIFLLTVENAISEMVAPLEELQRFWETDVERQGSEVDLRCAALMTAFARTLHKTQDPRAFAVWRRTLQSLDDSCHAWTPAEYAQWCAEDANCNVKLAAAVPPAVMQHIFGTADPTPLSVPTRQSAYVVLEVTPTALDDLPWVVSVSADTNCTFRLAASNDPSQTLRSTSSDQANDVDFYEVAAPFVFSDASKGFYSFEDIVKRHTAVQLELGEPSSHPNRANPTVSGVVVARVNKAAWDPRFDRSPLTPWMVIPQASSLLESLSVSPSSVEVCLLVNCSSDTIGDSLNAVTLACQSHTEATLAGINLRDNETLRCAACGLIQLLHGTLPDAHQWTLFQSRVCGSQFNSAPLAPLALERKVLSSLVEQGDRWIDEAAQRLLSDAVRDISSVAPFGSHLVKVGIAQLPPVQHSPRSLCRDGVFIVQALRDRLGDVPYVMKNDDLDSMQNTMTDIAIRVIRSMPVADVYVRHTHDKPFFCVLCETIDFLLSDDATDVITPNPVRASQDSVCTLTAVAIAAKLADLLDDSTVQPERICQAVRRALPLPEQMDLATCMRLLSVINCRTSSEHPEIYKTICVTSISLLSSAIEDKLARVDDNSLVWNQGDTLTYLDIHFSLPSPSPPTTSVSAVLALLETQVCKLTVATRDLRQAPLLFVKPRRFDCSTAVPLWNVLLKWDSKTACTARRVHLKRLLSEVRKCQTTFARFVPHFNNASLAPKDSFAQHILDCNERADVLFRDLTRNLENAELSSPSLASLTETTIALLADQTKAHALVPYIDLAPLSRTFIVNKLLEAGTETSATENRLCEWSLDLYERILQLRLQFSLALLYEGQEELELKRLLGERTTASYGSPEVTLMRALVCSGGLHVATTLLALPLLPAAFTDTSLYRLGDGVISQAEALQFWRCVTKQPTLECLTLDIVDSHACWWTSVHVQSLEMHAVLPQAVVLACVRVCERLGDIVFSSDDRQVCLELMNCEKVMKQLHTWHRSREIDAGHFRSQFERGAGLSQRMKMLGVSLALFKAMESAFKEEEDVFCLESLFASVPTETAVHTNIDDVMKITSEQLDTVHSSITSPPSTNGKVTENAALHVLRMRLVDQREQSAWRVAIKLVYSDSLDRLVAEYTVMTDFTFNNRVAADVLAAANTTGSRYGMRDSQKASEAHQSLERLLALCDRLIGMQAFGFRFKRDLFKVFELRPNVVKCLTSTLTHYLSAWETVVANFSTLVHTQLSPESKTRHLLRLGLDRLGQLDVVMFPYEGASSASSGHLLRAFAGDSLESIDKSWSRSEWKRFVQNDPLALSWEALEVVDRTSFGDLLKGKLKHMAEFLASTSAPPQRPAGSSSASKTAVVSLHIAMPPDDGAASGGALALFSAIHAVRKLLVPDEFHGDVSAVPMPMRDNLLVFRPGCNLHVERVKCFFAWAASAPTLSIVLFPDALTEAQQDWFVDALIASPLSSLDNNNSLPALVIVTGCFGMSGRMRHVLLQQKSCTCTEVDPPTDMEITDALWVLAQNNDRPLTVRAHHRGYWAQGDTASHSQSGKSFDIVQTHAREITNVPQSHAREVANVVLPLQLVPGDNLSTFLAHFHRHASSLVWIETVVVDQTTESLHPAGESVFSEQLFDDLLFQLLCFGQARSGGRIWRLHGKTIIDVELHFHVEANELKQVKRSLPLLHALSLTGRGVASAAGPTQPELIVPSVLPHTLALSPCNCNWYGRACESCPALREYFRSDTEATLVQMKRVAIYLHWVFHGLPQNALDDIDDPCITGELLFFTARELFVGQSERLRPKNLRTWLMDTTNTNTMLLPSLGMATAQERPAVFAWSRESELKDSSLAEKMADHLKSIQDCLIKGTHGDHSRVQRAAAAGMERMFGAKATADTMDKFPHFILSPMVMLRILTLGVHFALGLPLVLEGETGEGKTKLLEVFSFLVERCRGSAGCAIKFHQLDLCPSNTIESVRKWLHERTEKWQKGDGLANHSDCLPTCIVFIDEINCCTSGVLELLRSLMLDRHLMSTHEHLRISKDVWFVSACNPYRAVIHKDEATLSAAYTVLPLPHSLCQVRLPLDVLDLNDLNYIVASRVQAWLCEQKMDHADGAVFTRLLMSLHLAAEMYASSRWKQGAGAPAVSLRELDRTLALAGACWQHTGATSVLFHRLTNVNSLALCCLQMVGGVVYLSRVPVGELDLLVKSVGEIDANAKSDIEHASKAMHECGLALCTELRVTVNVSIVPTEGVQRMLLLLYTHAMGRCPVFLVGPPGSSKSLTLKLFTEAVGDARLRLESPFVRGIPEISVSILQCSKSLTEEALRGEFRRSKEYLGSLQSEQEAALVVLEELGLACSATDLPSLKVIHSLLDRQQHASLKNRVGFVALSNSLVDAAKMNRGTVMMVERMSGEEIQTTLQSMLKPGHGISQQSFDDVLLFLSSIRDGRDPVYFMYGCRDIFSFLNNVRCYLDQAAPLGDTAGAVNVLNCGCKRTLAHVVSEAVRKALLREFGGTALMSELVQQLVQHHAALTHADPMCASRPLDLLRQMTSLRVSASANTFAMHDRPLLCLTRLKPMSYWLELLHMPRPSKNEWLSILAYPGLRSSGSVAVPSEAALLEDFMVCMGKGGARWVQADESLYASLLDVLNGHAFIRSADDRDTTMVRVALRGRSLYAPMRASFRLMLVHPLAEANKWHPALLNRTHKIEFKTDDLVRRVVQHLVSDTEEEFEERRKNLLNLAHYLTECVAPCVTVPLVQESLALAALWEVCHLVYPHTLDSEAESTSSLEITEKSPSECALEEMQRIVAEHESSLLDNDHGRVASVNHVASLFADASPFFQCIWMLHSPFLTSRDFIRAHLAPLLGKEVMQTHTLMVLHEEQDTLEVPAHETDRAPLIVITARYLYLKVIDWNSLCGMFDVSSKSQSRPFVVFEVAVQAECDVLLAYIMDEMGPYIDELDCLVLMCGALDVMESASVRVMAAPNWRFCTVEPSALLKLPAETDCVFGERGRRVPKSTLQWRCLSEATEERVKRHIGDGTMVTLLLHLCSESADGKAVCVLTSTLSPVTFRLLCDSVAGSRRGEANVVRVDGHWSIITICAELPSTSLGGGQERVCAYSDTISSEPVTLSSQSVPREIGQLALRWIWDVCNSQGYTLRPRLCTTVAMQAGGSKPVSDKHGGVMANASEKSELVQIHVECCGAQGRERAFSLLAAIHHFVRRVEVVDERTLHLLQEREVFNRLIFRGVLDACGTPVADLAAWCKNKEHCQMQVLSSGTITVEGPTSALVDDCMRKIALVLEHLATTKQQIDLWALTQQRGYASECGTRSKGGTFADGCEQRVFKVLVREVPFAHVRGSFEVTDGDGEGVLATLTCRKIFFDVLRDAVYEHVARLRKQLCFRVSTQPSMYCRQLHDTGRTHSKLAAVQMAVTDHLTPIDHGVKLLETDLRQESHREKTMLSLLAQLQVAAEEADGAGRGGDGDMLSVKQAAEILSERLEWGATTPENDDEEGVVTVKMVHNQKVAREVRLQKEQGLKMCAVLMWGTHEALEQAEKELAKFIDGISRDLCCLCFVRKPVDVLIACPKGEKEHQMCTDCFVAGAKVQLKNHALLTTRLSASQQVQIVCTICGVGKDERLPAYAMTTVVGVGDESLLTALSEAQRRVTEQIVTEEVRKQVQAEYDRELERIRNMDTVDREVFQLCREVENMLNLACPRCKVAFVDFDGCLALKCSNCPCGFCALCLKDCGGDAHAHVLRCPKRNGADSYGRAGEFEEVHRLRRTRELGRILGNITNVTVYNRVRTSALKFVEGQHIAVPPPR